MSRPVVPIRIILQVAVVLGVVSTGAFVAAEDVPDLHDTIRKLIASRSEIKSYDLSITAKVDDEARPQELTDGSTFVPTRKLVAYELEMVLDTQRDRLLIARRDTHEDLAGSVRSTSDWHVAVVTPRKLSHVNDGGGRTFRLDYFLYDPLGLGVLFPGEFTRGDNWRSTAENYLKWSHQIQAEMIEEDVVRYTKGNNSFGQFLFDVDVRRDYWPLQLRLGDKDDIYFATQLKLSEEDGRWMPSSGKVTMPGMEHQLEFAWKSVNKPVDERFDPANLRQRYNIP